MLFGPELKKRIRDFFFLQLINPFKKTFATELVLVDKIRMKQVHWNKPYLVESDIHVHHFNQSNTRHPLFNTR